MIDKLVRAGMDVARLNFSHGTHEDRVRMVAALRRASAHYEKPIGVLADLQGPKIRTGKLVGGKPIRLRFGQRFTITTRNIPGTEEGVSTTFRALPASVKKGDRILLSDGDIALRVLSTHGQDVITQVENPRRPRRTQRHQSSGYKTRHSFDDPQGPQRFALRLDYRR